MDKLDIIRQGFIAAIKQNTDYEFDILKDHESICQGKDNLITLLNTDRMAAFAPYGASIADQEQLKDKIMNIIGTDSIYAQKIENLSCIFFAATETIKLAMNEVPLSEWITKLDGLVGWNEGIKESLDAVEIILNDYNEVFNLGNYSKPNAGFTAFLSICHIIPNDYEKAVLFASQTKNYAVQGLVGATIAVKNSEKFIIPEGWKNA